MTVDGQNLLNRYETIPNNFMKRIIAVFISLLIGFGLNAQTKRALTVFISDYPEWTGWKSLSSSNDKEMILNMLKNNGFNSKDIICIEDSAATINGIRSSFDDLLGCLTPGDFVYIHFSCHGQQITDIDGDERIIKPNDLYDEAIVPYDAGKKPSNMYSGENHFIDDELNTYLNSVRSKVGEKGQILLVVDACHSGDIQRNSKNEDEELNGMIRRGTGGKFDIPVERKSFKGTVKNDEWITISACRDNQVNWECNIGGKKCGRLSYAISKTMIPGMRFKDLVNGIQEVYSSLPTPSNLPQNVEITIPKAYDIKRLYK